MLSRRLVVDRRRCSRDPRGDVQGVRLVRFYKSNRRKLPDKMSAKPSPSKGGAAAATAAVPSSSSSSSTTATTAQQQPPNPQAGDALLAHQERELEQLRQAKPWTTEARYFTRVHVSACAAMKMMSHA